MVFCGRGGALEGEAVRVDGCHARPWRQEEVFNQWSNWSAVELHFFFIISGEENINIFTC
jgi:hypothetical protein